MLLRITSNRSDNAVAADVDVVHRIVFIGGYPDAHILKVSTVTAGLEDPRVSCLFERTM